MDPQVHRAWIIGQYCEGFHCTPLVAERELNADADQLGLLILDMRGLAAAKRAFDGTRDKVDGLKGWDGNPYMTLVETFTLAAQEAARQAKADGQ